MVGDEKKSARYEFPSILYDMLEDVSDDPGKSGIASWMPHGRAFRVHNGDRFETEVMPDYFRERYASFRYLLEQWGFTGLRKGKDRGAYYNLRFVRGQRHQIANVSKEEMLSAITESESPRGEPDFYSMPPALPDKPSRRTEDENASKHAKATKAKTNQGKSSKKLNPKTSSVRSSDPRRREAAQSEGESPSSDEDDESSSSSDDQSRGNTRRRQTAKRPLRGAVSARSNKRTKQSVASTSNDDLSMSEDGSSEDDSSEESPIVWAPTSAKFSGFKLPSKDAKLIIVKGSEDLGGEKPFTEKRPVFLRA